MQQQEQRPAQLPLLPSAELRARYRARLLEELATAPAGWQRNKALWYRYAIAPQERDVLSMADVAALWKYGTL